MGNIFKGMNYKKIESAKVIDSEIFEDK